MVDLKMNKAAWSLFLTGSLLQCLPAMAACMADGTRLSSEQVSAFVAAPRGLLSTFPFDDEGLSAAVANLAGASAPALRALRVTVQGANAQQSDAIGSGLARAVRICWRKDSAMAVVITDLALHSGNGNVARAFLQSTEDLSGPAAAASSAQDLGGSGGRTVTPGVSLGVTDGSIPDPFAALPSR